MLSLASRLSFLLPSRTPNLSLRIQPSRLIRTLPPPQQFPFKTEYYKKIDRVTQTVNTLVTRGSKQDEIDQYLFKALDFYFPSSHSRSRHRVYELIVSKLIDGRCFSAANTVYELMLGRGWVPSLDLDAQMLAVAVALSPSDSVTLLEAFDNVFTNPAFTEDRLLRTLQVMLDLGSPTSLVLNVVHNFLETKSEDYSPGKLLLGKLVDLQVRNDRLEDALESLARYNESSLGDRSRFPPQYPYVAIMSAIRDTKTWDEGAVNDVLRTMQTKGIETNSALFNVLISGEVRSGNLEQAFSIYAMLKALKAKKDPTMIPDAFTYGTLFNAGSRLANERSSREGRIQRTSEIDILPLRRLFFEMVETHHQSQSQSQALPNSDLPPILNTHVLNVALRAFLREQDYTAAYVVVRTFGQLKQAGDARTYYIVMKHIMNRIRRDIKRVRSAGESRWGDRFLGVPPHPDIYQMHINEALAKKVLAYGSQSANAFDITQSVVDLDSGDADSASTRPGKNGERRARHAVPSLEMMDGDEPVPPNSLFSLIPLKRILKRAVLAEGADPARGLSLPVGKRSCERWVVKMIRDAAKEMVPER